MKRSNKAKIAGKKTKIRMVEQMVPSEIVLHIFAAIADANMAMLLRLKLSSKLKWYEWIYYRS